MGETFALAEKHIPKWQGPSKRPAHFEAHTREHTTFEINLIVRTRLRLKGVVGIRRFIGWRRFKFEIRYERVIARSLVDEDARVLDNSISPAGLIAISQPHGLQFECSLKVVLDEYLSWCGAGLMPLSCPIIRRRRDQKIGIHVGIIKGSKSRVEGHSVNI